MKAIAIGLLAVVFFFIASCSSGPKIQFLGDKEPVDVPEDFFRIGCESCIVGDTIDVYLDPVLVYKFGPVCFGKTRPSMLELLSKAKTDIDMCWISEPRTDMENFIISSIIFDEAFDNVYRAVIIRKS